MAVYTLVVEVSEPDESAQDELISGVEDLSFVEQVVFCGPDNLVEVPEEE